MDITLIQKLIEMVNNSSLSVLEVEDESIRVRLENQKTVYEGKAETQQIPMVQLTSINSPVADQPVTPKEDDTKYKWIKSPIVGTYHSLATIGKPEVSVGDTVKKGQILCAVEAMKLMNEIESEFDGEVAEILVKDGDLVEFGQPLMKLL